MEMYAAQYPDGYEFPIWGALIFLALFMACFLHGKRSNGYGSEGSPTLSQMRAETPKPPNALETGRLQNVAIFPRRME
jgi:hypothetical protein